MVDKTSPASWHIKYIEVYINRYYCVPKKPKTENVENVESENKWWIKQ